MYCVGWGLHIGLSYIRWLWFVPEFLNSELHCWKNINYCKHVKGESDPVPNCFNAITSDMSLRVPSTRQLQRVWMSSVCPSPSFIWIHTILYCPNILCWFGSLAVWSLLHIVFLCVVIRSPWIEFENTESPLNVYIAGKYIKRCGIVSGGHLLSCLPSYSIWLHLRGQNDKHAKRA